MYKFQRGIKNPDFITALNKNQHFQNMVRDKDLFIAIRKEYINVYYYGQSICKISFNKKNREIKWISHKKYFGINENGYLNTGIYLEKIEELKLNAEKYKLEEKEQVKKHALDNEDICILDIEVGFGKPRAYIDYVTIENINGSTKLVFHEAKHFKNSDIRSKKEPKVFAQMKIYENLLHEYREDILISYNKVYENIIELNLNNKHKLVKVIGKTFDNIKIDTKPILNIFEFDSQRKGTDEHLRRLEKQFGSRLNLKHK
ncbi:hypothetical protein [Flavobacterium suzhouense]|uniref:Nuclease-related domain-containing protein n=1 Tax=Flavobacterium suzhouense TaxID=1529638 RepID=A0ABW5NYE0_9FLAO